MRFASVPTGAFRVVTMDLFDPLFRFRFRLRAADRVEKWSPAGRSDSGKSSPLIVRLAGSMCISVGGVSLRPALLLPGG